MTWICTPDSPPPTETIWTGTADRCTWAAAYNLWYRARPLVADWLAETL